MTSRNEPRPDPDVPLRVSTIELFLDLVFVFTIPQLTGMLALAAWPVAMTVGAAAGIALPTAVVATAAGAGQVTVKA